MARRRLFQLAVLAFVIVVGSGSSRADRPNGQIAYLAQSGDYWQVWVVGADGSNPRQVTTSAYEKTTCSWFPDGAHLLVNSLEGRLYRVATDSGKETAIDTSLPGTLDASVSPAGDRIAFSLSTAGSFDDNEIWVVDVDGSNLERLTDMPWLQNQPRWSADGEWIYFVSGDGTQAHDIWRVSPKTRSREQLTVGQLYHFELALAPDGSMAFSNNRTGNYEIYTQREGEPPKRRTHHPALDASPSFSPAGDGLVYHSTRGGDLNIWILRSLDGAAAVPIQLTDHNAGARSPDWGPPAREQR